MTCDVSPPKPEPKPEPRRCSVCGRDLTGLVYWRVSSKAGEVLTCQHCIGKARKARRRRRSL